MAADRAVKVTLTLSADQYKTEMEKAQKATQKLGDEQDGVSKSARESAKVFEEAAKRQEAAMQGVGTVLVAAGTAVAALGTAMLKTGIEYNTLQQTSRAALTSILGTAEAAADQMDRLDDFARNSPFSKQTFIQAQQQMLAFGIETERVLPYLDAIQNAVAAAGGSNQEISDLAAIFSKVSAAGKITAQDLMEFGNRGVDAASLIGSQMGKTGAEIREAITAGTLDADEALQMLAAGMTQRFDGAADNVKNTFAGAMDRVKAAWRDLSAALAEPFVSADGGGALTDLLNIAADLMRAFEALPGPIKGGIAVFIGLAGAAALLQGSLILLGPKLDEIKSRLSDVDTGALGSQLAMRGLAAGVAAVATAISSQMGESDSVLKGLVDTAGMTAAGFAVGGPWGAAIGGGMGLLKSFAKETTNFEGDLSSLTATLDAQTRAITENTVAWVAKQLQDSGAADEFAKVGVSLSEATESVLGNVDAQRQMLSALDASSEGGFRAIIAYGQLTQQVRDAQSSATDYDDALGEVDASQLEAGGSARTLAEDTARLREEWEAAALAAMGQRGAAIAQAQAQADANAAIAEGAQIARDAAGAVDLNVESSRNAESALIDLADANLKNIQAMDDGTRTAAELDAAFATQRQSFINTATQMGYTALEAEALADKYGLIPRSVQTEASLTRTAEWDEVYNRLLSDAENIALAFSTSNNGILGLATRTAALRQAALTPFGWAEGGEVVGPGTATSDSIPALLSNGEHVLTARDVQAMGGQAAVYKMRQMLHRYADGGAVQYRGAARHYAAATTSHSTSFAPSVHVAVNGRPTASDQQIGQAAADQAVFRLRSMGVSL